MRLAIHDSPNIHRTMEVVNHVRSLIEKGVLQPGDKIPPEREFARSLKISRASLRTGIGYMDAMGVIKVRRGIGTFVADGPPEFCKASLRLMGVPRGFTPGRCLRLGSFSRGSSPHWPPNAAMTGITL